MLIKNANIYGAKTQDLRVQDGLIVEIGKNLKPKNVNLSKNSSKNGKNSRSNDENSNKNSENSHLNAKNSSQNSKNSNSTNSQFKSQDSSLKIKKSTANSTQSATNHAEEVLDAKGLTLLPSFIDLNVSLKNDHFSIENLRLLEAECLKSGLCALVLKDTMDFNEESLALFLEHLKGFKIKIFATVRVLDGFNKLKNLSTLINKGACALSCESKVLANVLRQSMQYAQMKDKPLFVHCYESGYDDKGVMNDGQTSFELGLVGISEVSEFSEVAKIKQVAKFYKTKVLYECLSLKSSLDLLDEKDLIQTSIHHLLKTDEECEDFNTFAKLMPPLRSKKDNLALQNALKGGKISFLSSLHSPKSIVYKDVSFDEAGFGVHSICEYLSLCYSFLIKSKFLSWQELCKFTSLNQAKFLGLNSGEIAVGKEANLILFDENASLQALPTSLYHKDKLFGEIRAHFIRGERVF